MPFLLLICLVPVYFADAATEHEGPKIYFLLPRRQPLGSGNLEAKGEGTAV